MGYYKTGSALSYVTTARDREEGVQKTWDAEGRLTSNYTVKGGDAMVRSGSLTVSPFIRRGVQILLVSGPEFICGGACRLGDRGGNGNLPFYSTPDFTAVAVARLSTLRADTQDRAIFIPQPAGELVSQASLAGKIYVANFFFTSCPGICPKMTSHLLRIQRAFASDDEVRLVSHSVMPDKDTVEVLQATTPSSMTSHQENGTCSLGTKEAISFLGSGVVLRRSSSASKKPGEFLHTETCCSLIGGANSRRLQCHACGRCRPSHRGHSLS